MKFLRKKTQHVALQVSLWYFKFFKEVNIRVLQDEFKIVININYTCFWKFIYNFPCLNIMEFVEIVSQLTIAAVNIYSPK